MYTVSQAFLDELKQPVQGFRVKMQVLDTDGNPIDGGTFHDVAYQSDTTNILVDGTVDVDVTRGARRTFTATLLNNFGEWSPNAEWTGFFYVDRLVKLYRGMVFANGSEELVPIGVFFIDHADVIVERNMSVVSLSGTDKWKKIAKSQFTEPFFWNTGTAITNILRDVAEDAGIPLTLMSIANLHSRDDDERLLNKRLNVERGDQRSDLILQIGKDFGLDIYFDPDGIYTVQDMQNPADQAVVFRYLATSQ